MALLSPTQPAVAPSDAAIAAPQTSPQRMPRRPGPSVAELSARLYAAYRVTDGTVHLAGCTLEPQPVVRAVATAAGRSPIELFIGPTGELLDPATAGDLGLTDLVAADKPPRIDRQELERLCAMGRLALEHHCRELHTEDSADLLFEKSVEIVWCRWAAGKLRFTIGRESVEVPFADWAVRLSPPPFVCPHSGKTSFTLAATDDGRIVAAEEIAPCEQSGRRTLRQELVLCSATGKHVAPDLAEKCPATRQWILRDQMVACPVCGLRVSPQAVVGNRCSACANLTPVTKSDPRMCLILGEHQGLDRWHRWRLAETPQAYILEARGLVRRLLVVIDQQSLQPIRLASRARFQSSWTDIPRDRWHELLR